MTDDSGFDRVSPTWFDHYVNNLASLFGEPTPLDQIPPALGGTRSWAQDASDGTPLVIDKRAAVIEVPVDLLMDMGAIPDTRVPNKPYRPTLRRRIRDWRERIAYRAFRLIAGYDVPDREDW